VVGLREVRAGKGVGALWTLWCEKWCDGGKGKKVLGSPIAAVKDILWYYFEAFKSKGTVPSQLPTMAQEYNQLFPSPLQEKTKKN